MDWKNIIALAGVLLTFLLGLYNLRANRALKNRTHFVGTITAERIKWLEKIRVDISRFSGLTSFWVKNLRDTENEESKDVLKEIDVLRVMIKLRLNPEGIHDKEIMKLLDSIPQCTNQTNLSAITSQLDQLTIHSQKLLKEEWERVKTESTKGKEIKII